MSATAVTNPQEYNDLMSAYASELVANLKKGTSVESIEKVRKFTNYLGAQVFLRAAVIKASEWKGTFKGG